MQFKLSKRNFHHSIVKRHWPNKRFFGMVFLCAFVLLNLTFSTSRTEAILQTIIYVDADAPGLNNGSSWKNAYTDLQSALAAATTTDAIWVAAGVYTTPGNNALATFQLVNGVELYGGFNGSETAVSQRDLTFNLTILSGDIGGDDITSPDGFVTDINNIVGTNASIVVTSNNISSSAVLDGFYITAGDSTSFGSTAGGILINSSSPIIRNTTFIGNRGVSGGGLTIRTGSNPSISNVTVKNNHATSRGGGIYIASNSNPILQNVVISENSSLSQGGGIYSTNSNPVLTNLTVQGNTTLIDGGGIYIGTGGSSVLDNVLVSGNKTLNSSGSEGGGIHVFDSDITMSNLTVVGNFASLGGGIANTFSTLSVNNSIIWGNGDDNTAATASSYENFAATTLFRNSDIENITPFQSSASFNNIDSDPLFVSSINSAAAPTISGDFQLQSASPAIDTGNSGLYTSSSNEDLAGNTRINGSAIDMGVYESNFLGLSLTLGGAGTGTVTASGINCPSDCTENYVPNTMVTLTAVADTGSNFAGWDGAIGCSSNPVCSVTMDSAKNVIATFNLNSYGLSVVVNPSNGGSLTSSPAGINCPSDCNEIYTYGDVITLTPTAAAGYEFTGWGGAGGCTGLGPCDVNIDTAKLVRADFSAVYTLDINKAGSGSGTISSNPAGINCGTDCSMSAVDGTIISLSATAMAGSIFTGWSGGGCSGTGNCDVALDASKSVTASFEPAFDLTISQEGSGSGNIMSNPAGINCGSICSMTAEADSSITLSASAAPGSIFIGWSGAGCSGTGSCVVTLDVSKTVTADFAQLFDLAVTKSGDGDGTVTSSPTGIDCGSSCSISVIDGNTITLTATADDGSLFIGWSGAGCSGTGGCSVTMDEAKSVTAAFAKLYDLTITVSGDGSGTVTSNPTGIDCGDSCVMPVTSGTLVTLTATADDGSVFVGWSSGGCSGTDACNVMLDESKSITAEFRLGNSPSSYSIYLPLTGRP